MGYDMTILSLTDLGETGYCRRNMFGMRWTRNVMRQLGMLRYSEIPKHPENDKHPTGDDAFEKYWGWMHDVACNLQPLMGEFEHSIKENVAWRRDGAGLVAGETGIQVHKLCSNDYWIVTPHEIREALANARKLSSMPGWTLKSVIDLSDEAYWSEWLTFLKRAAEHHGFWVG